MTALEKEASNYADAKLDHWIETAERIIKETQNPGLILGISCRAIAYTAFLAGAATRSEPTDKGFETQGRIGCDLCKCTINRMIDGCVCICHRDF